MNESTLLNVLARAARNKVSDVSNFSRSLLDFRL